MNLVRLRASVVALATAGVVSACAPLRVSVPERPGQTLTVLLPDTADNSMGRANVSNPSGSTDLAAPRDATVAYAGQAPTLATPMSESDVERIFGDALRALPPDPQRFTLYFRFESDELTPESRSTVREILQAIKDRPVPELLVVGHTDTTGTPAANFDLGRKRAEMVRLFLISSGLDPSAIAVASHGESDLEVPTADDVFEPRNRRVDISVR